MRSGRKIRILVVDDSAVVRQSLKAILDADPELEVIAVAADPYVAVERIKKQVPDVITLDIQMPRMDGLTFLDKIMSQHPIPVVICSAMAQDGSAGALAALERGAVAIIAKPEVGAREFLEETRIRICDAVKSAAHARMPHRRPPVSRPVSSKLTADAILPRLPPRLRFPETERLIAVGASTGGTEALRELLQGMPPDAPGIAIVQHMPEDFTTRFAERLNALCQIEVKEAVDGDPIERGLALVAPGNHHLLVRRRGTRYYAEVKDGPLVSRHRPSVDVLFRSVACEAGPNAVGVILTGMGDDGSRCMLEMKQAGAFNIAQDESSCVVFGMPMEAIRLNAVDRVLPLNKIAIEAVRATSARR